MKKVVFFLLAFCFSMNVFANNESGIKVHLKASFSISNIGNNINKASGILNETQPLCSACCTISTSNSDGTSITQSACVRNSDCALAATSACIAAKIAALKRAIQ